MMTTRFTSADGLWQVMPITLNGRELLRISTKSIEKARLHWTGSTRIGLVKGPGGWYWVADVKTPAEVEQYVPLAELSEEKS